MEISKYTKDRVKFQPTNYKTADGCEILYAYLEERIEHAGKEYEKRYKIIHFFISYYSEIEEELKHIEGLREHYTGDFYEEIKENIIIGGNMYPSNYNPTVYLDSDLGLRTPPREHLSDWMERFSLIQNFVMEYSNDHTHHNLHKVIT
jgi:hypothetical protein